MPRVKLILHGHTEDDYELWGYPIYPYGECPHPRMARYFDPRWPAPYWQICRACGESHIDPWLGFSEEEIAEAKARGREMYERVFGTDA